MAKFLVTFDNGATQTFDADHFDAGDGFVRFWAKTDASYKLVVAVNADAVASVGPAPVSP